MPVPCSPSLSLAMNGADKVKRRTSLESSETDRAACERLSFAFFDGRLPVRPRVEHVETEEDQVEEAGRRMRAELDRERLAKVGIESIAAVTGTGHQRAERRESVRAGHSRHDVRATFVRLGDAGHDERHFDERVDM